MERRKTGHTQEHPPPPPTPHPPSKNHWGRKTFATRKKERELRELRCKGHSSKWSSWRAPLTITLWCVSDHRTQLNPPCHHALWKKTEVPGKTPRQQSVDGRFWHKCHECVVWIELTDFRRERHKLSQLALPKPHYKNYPNFLIKGVRSLTKNIYLDELSATRLWSSTGEEDHSLVAESSSK